MPDKSTVAIALGGKRTVKMSIIVAVLVCVLLFVPSCSRKLEEKPPPPAVKVGTRVVDRGVIVKALDVSGTLEFVRNTTVSSEVSAQILSLEVEDGQSVEAGQVMLVFDESKIRASADQARAAIRKNEATLELSKTEWKKYQELLKTAAVSEITYEQKYTAYRNAVAQLEENKAALDKALEDLKHTKVKAPIAGILSHRHVEVGDWVSEGGKLFQISDHSRIRLEAWIPDVDVGKLDVKKAFQDGIAASTTVDAYPGKTFKGMLTYVRPAAAANRLFLIRIYLENPDMTLLQGMFARARVPYEVMQGVLRVPLEALLEQVRDNDNNTVFMVDSTAKAQLVRIKIGTSDPNYAQVLEGLKENDRVVVHGKDMLSSKQPVNATDLPAPPDEHLFSPQASGQDKSSEREKDRKTPDALPGSSDSGDAK